jgi:hypothetical protein
MTEPKTLQEVEQELAEIYERTFGIYRDLMKHSETKLPDAKPFIAMRQAISAIQMETIRLRNGK